MLLTPHTLVGIALAYTIQDPVYAVPISFGMHFVGDLVPHWDFYTSASEMQIIKGWRPLAVMADLGLGVFFGTAFTLYALWVLNNPNLALTVFLSGIAAVLPDAISAPVFFAGKKGFPFEFVAKIQEKLQTSAKPIFGTLTQLLIGGFSLLLILHSVGL